MRRYVAASSVTDRQTHRMTTVTLAHAPRVNKTIPNVMASSTVLGSRAHLEQLIILFHYALDLAEDTSAGIKSDE